MIKDSWLELWGLHRNFPQGGRGTLYSSGPEKPLETIDFTDPWGQSPLSPPPPVYASARARYKKVSRHITCVVYSSILGATRYLSNKLWQSRTPWRKYIIRGCVIFIKSISRLRDLNKSIYEVLWILTMTFGLTKASTKN